MATVRRLRLQRAAERLANSDRPIAAVARTSGYSSVPAFSKAFSAAYGTAPGRYRESGGHARYKRAAELDDGAAFVVKVIASDPLSCATARHDRPYIEIDRAMSALVGALAQAGAMPSQPQMMATFLDDPDVGLDRPLRSAACMPIDEAIELPASLERTTIRGGDHAVLLYRGPYSDMKGAYTWLYGTWLSDSAREAADAPAVEVYLNDPRTVAPGDLLTEIRLPLELVV